MKRVVKTTADGSKTLFIAELDEHYHSFHGAYSESIHVFINAGLHHLQTAEVNILEIGFGTGLNALVTYADNQTSKRKIRYSAVEAYPVKSAEWRAVDYTRLTPLKSYAQEYTQMHNAEWEKEFPLDENFEIIKKQKKFQEIDAQSEFDLIYFDAFAPSAQPELWTEDIFKLMYKALKPNGILVTYCAKGQVKRNMKTVGFQVEGLPGPPGKREMTRATKE